MARSVDRVAGAAGTDGAAIRRRVRGTWRAVLAVRATESLLVGTSAAVTGCAAAVASGAALASATTLAALAVCGLAGAGAWWSEHRLDERAVARRMDRRLGAGGALVAAWEAAARPATDVVRLLCARVRARFVTRAPGERRRVLPESLPLVALPFVAVALLALALEARRAEDGRAPVASLVAGLAAELGELRGDLLAGRLELSPEEAARLVDLSAGAARIARSIEPGAEPDRAERAELARLEAGLAELAERTGPRAAARLDRARTWADALRAAARPPAVDPAAAGRRPPTDGAPAGAARTADSAAGGEPGAAGTSSGPEVAAGPGDGTMSGRPDPDRGAPSAAEPAAAAPAPADAEAGLAAGRWWAPRHDPVVRRWIDARRAARPERR